MTQAPLWPLTICYDDCVVTFASLYNVSGPLVNFTADGICQDGGGDVDRSTQDGVLAQTFCAGGPTHIPAASALVAWQTCCWGSGAPFALELNPQGSPPVTSSHGTSGGEGGSCGDGGG